MLGNVFGGTVPEEILKVPIPATDFRAGLEVGAVKPMYMEGVGDMLLVNGYSCSVST